LEIKTQFHMQIQRIKSRLAVMLQTVIDTHDSQGEIRAPGSIKKLPDSR